MITRRTFFQSGAAVAVIAASASSARADNAPGVTDTEIKFGQTMPYSGPASAYGVIGKTEAAYFKMINEQGGINGRKLNFISLDDGYSPPKTVEQVRRLVEDEKVAFLFQTPGNRAQSRDPAISQRQQGAAAFRPDRREHLFRSRAFPLDDGLQSQLPDRSAHLRPGDPRDKPDAKIGVLYQNDGFGKDYLIGLKDGLGADQPAWSSRRHPTKSRSRPSIRRSSACRVRRQRLSHRRHAQIRRPGDPQILRHRLERRRAISAMSRPRSPPC